jgi:hypothetical protein
MPEGRNEEIRGRKEEINGFFKVLLDPGGGFNPETAERLLQK